LAERVALRAVVFLAAVFFGERLAAVLFARPVFALVVFLAAFFDAAILWLLVVGTHFIVCSAPKWDARQGAATNCKFVQQTKLNQFCLSFVKVNCET
jgi:hypothetical protein